MIFYVFLNRLSLLSFFAWGISTWLQLPLALASGMILVGASPGGTASNVICYLAKGNVALSITITTFSTLLAVIAMPALSLLYLGKQVDVPAMKMLMDIIKIIILPVTAGIIVNQLFGRFLSSTKQVLLSPLSLHSTNLV